MKTIISGVYIITNSVNGHRYIGSSANMSHRKKIHRDAAKNICVSQSQIVVKTIIANNI